MDTDVFKALFYPETVAVIGATEKKGKVGHALIDNLLKTEGNKQIIPINPKSTEILGKPCYKSLREYKGNVDLSVIAVPTKAVKDAVQSSLDAGARAVIVITAGFKETGPVGAVMERKIAKLCQDRGARLMGPNCLGLINTQHALNASFATQLPSAGSVSVISQSGALCTAILDWTVGRHLGLAKLVSVGNKADLDEIEFLGALAEDEQTKVIIGYLEGISSGNRFIKAAEAVTLKKPVVILKSGTSAAGGRAASSHTGSLVGADIAYGAAFKRSGIIRADTFEALLDYATALAMQPLPQGDRVAIITNAGGPGIMAADAVELQGMEVAILDRATASALKAKLPPAASVGNPIDVLGDADPERYATAIKAAQDDDAVDAIIVLLAPQAMTLPAETARAIGKAIRGEKPVLAAFMGGKEVMPGRDELVTYGLPDFPSPERAVAALKAMVDYYRWRHKPPRVVTRFPVNRRRVERIIGRYVRGGQHNVGEVDAKEILRAYDFKIPTGQIAQDVDQAVEIARSTGFPVAMKIVSPDIIHKSDLGGVKLNLSTPDAVADAFDLMMLRINRKMPEANLRGVYIEKMADRGIEVIIGMTRDPQFGPMLMFGLGGIFVEVMKDVTFHLAPITADEAMQMLKATKSYAMLEGVRGQTGVDLSAIANGLQRLSQLVSDFPQIVEVDINPFIVGPAGTEPIVADARMSLLTTGSEHE
ncbi:MAG: acetate--CoA ligase family protein [Myxococcota bacterium]|nr:acetate--CoA ligase family protein [Myxococcota bacterium]